MDVQEIIDAFTMAESLPKEAIAEAAARREELLPRFLEEMEAFIAGAEEDEVPTPVFMIFHLLGSWREKRAYRTMARLLAADGERLYWALGEAEADTIHRVMVNVYDGNPQPLFDIIESEQASEDIRSNMIVALAMLVRQGDLARDTVVDYLRAAPERLKPRRENMLWYGVQMAIAMLGATELADMVKRLFDQRLVPSYLLTFDEFRHDLDTGCADLIEKERLIPFGDIEEELASWSLSADPDLEIDEEELEAMSDEELEEALIASLADYDPLQAGIEGNTGQRAFQPVPAVNMNRDVGRNDPCPCGSGKKFKKCCGR